MITISLPEWFAWACVAMFFLQWIMNGILAYQHKKLEASRRALIKSLEGVNNDAMKHSKAFLDALEAVRFMSSAPSSGMMQ